MILSDPFVLLGITFIFEDFLLRDLFTWRCFGRMQTTICSIQFRRTAHFHLFHVDQTICDAMKFVIVRNLFANDRVGKWVKKNLHTIHRLNLLNSMLIESWWWDRGRCLIFVCARPLASHINLSRLRCNNARLCAHMNAMHPMNERNKIIIIMNKQTRNYY